MLGRPTCAVVADCYPKSVTSAAARRRAPIISSSSSASLLPCRSADCPIGRQCFGRGLVDVGSGFTRRGEGAPGRQDPDGGLSRLVLGVEMAVGEVEDLVAAFGDAGVVGGDDDDASAACDGEDELERLLLGCVVEFGGEFVGEQDIGFGDEGARDGDALLLASGQFLDEVVGVGAESDALEHVCRVATYVGSGESAGGEVWLERDFDVFRGGEQVSQTVGLQDEPESGGGWVAVDGARVGTLKPAEEREEAGFAAAGRAGDGDDLAGRDQERDVIKQGAPGAVIADVGGDQG